MRRRRDAVNVRSHRRGGRRRRLVLAPWIVISTVSVLLLSGISAGYAWLVSQGCSGNPIQMTVLSSPDLSRILDNLGRRWTNSGPEVDGRCAGVKVVSKSSAEVSQALGPSWDPRRDGPRPTVWVPDSTAWLKLASARDDAARLIPDRQPSLARTPTVIGMPMPMAKALGWPNARLSWKQLGSEFASGKSWAQFGHPEWGPFKIGMTSPVTSTAGLHALTAVADTDDDGRITDSERRVLTTLSRTMKVYADDPTTILGELTKRDVGGEKKVLPYLSAFPILEHDLREYNDTNPRVPIAAVYPTDGSADADYPYLTLDAPWSKPAERQAAKQFLAFLRGPEGRQAFLDNFYRDPNRRGSSKLTAAYGVQPEVKTLPRAVLVPDSVSLTVATWVASNQPTNVLFVLDVGKSMGAAVRGTDEDRLGLAAAATSHAVSLLSDKAGVGLWALSSQIQGDSDHLERASIGPLSSDGRRGLVQADLARIRSGNAEACGVYDTAVEAYQALSQRYVPNARNLVVLITDGHDDGKGRSLEDAVAKLTAAKNPERPIHLVTIGYGPQARMQPLDQLATATGGRSYHVQYETDINSVLITALFNA
jgi:Ca-activated chloride channel family protein